MRPAQPTCDNWGGRRPVSDPGIFGCTIPMMRLPAMAVSTIARYRGSKIFNGRRARGSSSTPVSGKTGITEGRSAALRYLLGLCIRLREQQRRKPPPRGDRAGVGRAHGLEQSHQLLARSVLIPFAVPLHDIEQFFQRLVALAVRIEAEREIITRLEVRRVTIHLRPQLRDVAGACRLFLQLQFRFDGAYRF